MSEGYIPPNIPTISLNSLSAVVNGSTPKFLYIFLDESGDLAFNKNGSKYFLLTSITKERPFNAPKLLYDLRYELLENGEEVEEYFHACNDKQSVRNRVFDVIRENLNGVFVDALVVDKAKTGPALQAVERFYPEMLGYHLRYILRQHPLNEYHEVLVFVATLHTGKQKKAMEKAVKQTLAKMLPPTAKYRLIYHSAKANYDIQIADYCGWAIQKKLTSNEHRPYNIIKPAIRSEFDIFRRGTRLYY